MKKLMIAAAAAAMVGGAFASTCGESYDACVAYDLTFSLKTLAPKAVTCKDVCGEKSKVYYLDQVSRKLKGYMWSCCWDCDSNDSLNIVLWDEKNKKTMIPYYTGDYDCDTPYPYTVTFGTEGFKSLWVYGKKANKVAVNTLTIAGVDCDDNATVNLTAGAVGGTVGTLNTGCGVCMPYVKSVSGYAVGSISMITWEDVDGDTIYDVANGLCGETKKTVCEETTEDIEVKYLTLCDVCCFENWCEDGEVFYDGDTYTDTTVPAVGTWTMKYNKKMATGSKNITSYLPSWLAACGE